MSDTEKVEPKGKYTKAAISDRRRRVFELVLLKGHTEGAVAKVLGVHRNTVVGDMRIIREIMRETLGDFDPMAEVGVQAAKYEAISQMALYDSTVTKNVAIKAPLYSAALRALAERTKLLFDAGILKEVPKRVEGTLEISGGINLEGMSLEELKSRRDQLVNRLSQFNMSPRLSASSDKESGN